MGPVMLLGKDYLYHGYCSRSSKVQPHLALTSVKSVLGMTGPPNSFTARGPVTLTAILFTQPAV